MYKWHSFLYRWPLFISPLPQQVKTWDMQTIIFTPPTFSLFPVWHVVNKIVTWVDKLSLCSRFTNEKNPETRTWSVLKESETMCIVVSCSGWEGGRVWMNLYYFQLKFNWYQFLVTGFPTWATIITVGLVSTMYTFLVIYYINISYMFVLLLSWPL
jgi:hypothetical protein